MKIKKILLSILLINLLHSIFAVNNPYSGANEETKQILEKCNQLVDQKKYESAYNFLNNSSKSDEYILAKEIEICINYFSQSIMHQMFCLSDLEDGQTLFDVRNGTGSYNMVMINDPVKMVESFTKENGSKPILNYILGLYYSSVFNCYGSNWLKNEEEILTNISNYLQQALDQNCYSGYSISELAISYLRLGDYDKANQIYEFKKSTDEIFTVEDNYNNGYGYYLKQDYDKALIAFLQSVKDYKDNPNYLFDTYLTMAEIYINTQKYSDCEKSLKNCIKIFENDYRIYNYQIILYALQKSPKKLLSASQKLFSLAPENPSAPQMIMNNYFDFGAEEYLIDFFVKTEEKYKDNLKAMQNLYFHHAFSLSFLDRMEEAKEIAQISKQYFEKDNSLTEEIAQQLESIAK